MLFFVFFVCPPTCGLVWFQEYGAFTHFIKRVRSFLSFEMFGSSFTFWAEMH